VFLWREESLCIVRVVCAAQESMTQTGSSRHFHVHDVHEGPSCLDSIPLSPFFSVEGLSSERYRGIPATRFMEYRKRQTIFAPHDQRCALRRINAMASEKRHPAICLSQCLLHLDEVVELADLDISNGY
jgi:hypothetical protein